MVDKATEQTHDQAEQRSLSAIVAQFVSDAQHGAGWTAGAAVVAGVVKKVNDALPGGKGDKPKT